MISIAELTSEIISQKGYKYNLFIFDINGIDITYKFYF